MHGLLISYSQIAQVLTKPDVLVIIVSAWLKTHNLRAWELKKNHKFFTKAYREAQDNLDILLDFGKKHIQTAKYNYKTGKTDTDQLSILKKMVRRCDSESSYPLVMALGE